MMKSRHRKVGMVKQEILQAEVDDILQSIKLFPQGASLEEINKGLKSRLHPRTLQRRLALLVEKGSLWAQGQARARRYLIPAIEKEPAPHPQEPRNHQFSPRTPESFEIQRIVSQPRNTRTYVSYNREFLDEYQPNVTRYLPQEATERLFKLGQTDGERPEGTYARQIYNRLLIDLSWNSSRLEGNTYSLLETERLLEQSEAAEGKDSKEARMILNHKEAIEFLIESAEHMKINRYVICNVHALLSQGLLDNPDACGRTRTIPVGIGDSVYIPTAVPQLLEECFQHILDKANAIDNPFEQAFFLMVHLPYLQLFEDVNKRVSRLAANIPLIRMNLSPLSFVDVPIRAYIDGLLGIYELNRIDLLRDVFMWAYERSSMLYSTTRKTIGEPDPFRMRYRNFIYETVTDVVLGCMDKKQAIAKLRQKAEICAPAQDRLRFIEVVEIELRSLHEGNIARFRLRPSEYEKWRKMWV